MRSVASIGALLAQAPPPADGRIIAAVSAVVLDASGRTLTGQFQEPAQVQVVIPATSTEASGALSGYVIVFWTGSAWTELPTRVVREADGAIRLTAEAQHFTLFAVKRRVAATEGGAFAGVPVFGPGGQAFAVFTRGLEVRAAAAGASGVCVQDPSGRFRLLIISGPAFLGAEFRAAFPAGFGSATAVTLVRPA